MNSCEKMQIANLNLKAGRGRSLETKIKMALQKLRRERRGYSHAFSVEVIDETGLPMLYDSTNSLRQARFWQLRNISAGWECGVFDTRTGLQIY